MPLDQQRTLMLGAVLANPHRTLVLGDDGGTLHQAFFLPWNGWQTDCGRLDAAWVPLEKLRYGRPDCLDCLATNKPEPKEVGGAERQVLLYHETKGHHVHVAMFMGNATETLANIGGVTVLEHEWLELRAMMVLGCKSLGIRLVMEERSP